jgi:hypothetical protein
MRDRSRARNYSASRDEFRRAHERHREWGLQRRHSERLRQIREREAGCWPADLEVVGVGVEGDRSGIADELSAGSARLLVRRGTRGRACASPARSVGPARSGRPGPPRSPATRRRAHSREAILGAIESRSAPSTDPVPRAGAQPWPRASRRTGRRRNTTPAPPRPGRRTPEPTDPASDDPTRTKPAAADQQSHDQNTRRKAIPTLPDNLLNPRREPQQNCRTIPP